MPDAVPMTVLKVSHHNAQHIATRYPYAAYGSNLMMAQINERCPRVELVTAGSLIGHRLDFAKVATITADRESSVPVGIYALNATDIERLDKKEGMGRVYDRYLVTPITDDNRALRCFTYIKRDHVLEPPTPEYFGKLLHGYRDWHFDDRRLRRARERAVEAWDAAAPARAAADRMLHKMGFRHGDKSGVRWQSAGEAWRQGDMWEPEGSNVVPLHHAAKRYVTLRHDQVEWGQRGEDFYFRQKGTRVWYKDVSGHEHVSAGMVCGELATNLPGAGAYKPIEKGNG